MSKRLLPLIPPGLAVVQVLPTPDRITIVAQPRSPTAACPDCGTPSCSVHSRYERHLADLPWQGRSVALRIQARRFRCAAPTCIRKTFAERLSGVAAAAARFTERLGGLHSCLGLALGGKAGMRLAARLAIDTSPDTLLGAERKTVRGWLRRDGAPSWQKPRRGSALDPYVSLLERRWAEGCHSAARLWRKVAAGYAGRPGTVRAWATRRRGEQAASGAPLCANDGFLAILDTATEMDPGRTGWRATPPSGRA